MTLRQEKDIILKLIEKRMAHFKEYQPRLLYVIVNHEVKKFYVKNINVATYRIYSRDVYSGELSSLKDGINELLEWLGTIPQNRITYYGEFKRKRISGSYTSGNYNITVGTGNAMYNDFYNTRYEAMRKLDRTD